MLTVFIVDTASDNNSGVADGLVSLREAIIAANTNSAFGDAPAGEANGDVIRFDPSIYNSTMPLTLGQISISDDVLIQGGVSNITIQGNGNTRLFEVAATERVGFSKLTFAQGNASIGGAITAIGSGTTLLVETTFINNEATGTGGGAIYYANGNMFVTDSVFQNNRATGLNGSGGAIYSVSGNIYTTRGSITSNSANRSGGGLEITGGTFFSIGLQVGTTGLGNVAGPVGSANPGNGGGLHVMGTGRATIQGGAFVNNFAGQSGGGMYVDGASANLFVRPGTNVTSNRSNGANIGDGGGGIFNNASNLFVNQATISSNTASGASGSGGGIFASGGKVTINAGTVSSNAATRVGGGIYVNNTQLQLTNSNVTLNDVGVLFATPVGHGGGIYATGTSTVVVDDGQVANNRTTNQGGGIWAGPSTLVFIRNTGSVSFNVVTASGSAGGGVYTSGYINMKNAFVQRNEAELLGGGMFLSNPATQARIDTTAFFGNNSGSLGGGIHNTGSMYVTNSSFTQNVAGDNGGGYFKAAGSTTLVSNLTFSSNTPNNFNS